MKRGAEARDAPALPPCIWKAIFDEVARDDDIYRAPLRLVCRDWLAWATVDRKDVGHDHLMMRAAFDGLVGICELARGWMLADYDEHEVRYGTGPPPWWPIADEMAGVGASGGHMEIVEIAMRWGADPHLAAMEAAARGDAEICIRLLDRGLSKRDIEAMLRHGFCGEHEAVCQLAVLWGAHDFVDMLDAGMRRGGDRSKLADLAGRLMRSNRSDDPQLRGTLADCYGRDDVRNCGARWGIGDDDDDDDDYDWDRSGDIVAESPPRASPEISRRKSL